MYYNKKIHKNGRRRAYIYVDDFSYGMTSKKDKSLLPLSACYMSFNVDSSNGAIKDGMGVKCSDVFGSETLPSVIMGNLKAERLYYFKRYDEGAELYIDYLMFYANDKNIYQCILNKDTEFYQVGSLTFESAPEMVTYTYNGKDVAIFSCKNIMKLYDGDNVTTIDNAPVITSMCMHSERLFATEGGEKTALWFSDDFNPMNWNISLKDAGFIDLRDGRGSLLKVLSFGGYVYVFRNYGITRITAFGDQTNFSVDGVTASSGKIYKDSITICGDRIIYLAEDGFYAFSGGTPVRILKDFDGYIKGCNNINAKGCYYNGVFYCKITINNDNNYEDVLLIYNVHSGNFTVGKNFNIEDFILMEGENKFKLLFLINGYEKVGELCKEGQFFGHPLKKMWKSGNCDLNNLYDKTITKLTLWSESDVEVKIESENNKVKLYFKGGKGSTSLPVGIKGNLFNFTIESDKPNMNITRMKIDYEYDVK